MNSPGRLELMKMRSCRGGKCQNALMHGSANEPAQIERRIIDWINGADEASFDSMACALHAFHFRANDAYRAFCRSLGVAQTVAFWRDIPCVPQAAFKHADLRSFPAGETIATFRTSGTTGEGFGSHHFRTLEVYETAIREGWRRAGLPSGPFLVIAPHPDEAPHSSLSHMLATLAKREDFIASQAAIDISRLQAVREPVTLLGTALGFLRLFEQLGGNAIRLPEGSAAMETGGYKGSGRHIEKPELYAMFTAKLGIDPENTFNEYGMTELSSQFYARGPHGAHSGPPWARAIVADPVTLCEVNDGGTGILLLYDAANVGSVVGIRTQDLAVRRGDSFELLGRDPSALPRGCSRAADEWFGR